MQPGLFVWHDLASADAASSAGFYGGLVGWRARRVAQNGETLLTRVLRHAEEPVAHIVPTAGTGVAPAWRPHLAVADVQAHLDQAVARGAHVVQPPVPGPLGRFALVADPTGGVYGAVEASGRKVSADVAPGRFVWHQLTTTDLDAALGYYGALFGWRRNGPPGPHAFMALGDVQVGALSQEAHPSVSRWLAYLAVDDVASALAAAEALGAEITVPMREVPPLGKLAILEDPGGARVGVIFRPVG